jgi:Clp amino terminal domain, pathogenicity island component
MANFSDLAKTILLLAFTEPLQPRVAESSKHPTIFSLVHLSELRQQILNHLQGESGVTAIISLIEAQGTLVPDQIQFLVPALAVAMQSDSSFANRISQLANAISQELSANKLSEQNMQSVAGGTATQVNAPNAPTFAGSVTGSTFNFYYGPIQPPQTSSENRGATTASPQRNPNLSPQALIEHYLQTNLSELEPVDIRAIEQALQSDTLDASTLAQGCILLRKEKGVDLVINQLDWIYELAFIADGSKPRYFLPDLRPTGRLASTAWMEALLQQGLPGHYSGSVALTLGAFGVFIPEIVPPLRFLFTNSKYALESRDAALIYLSLMGSPEVISMLIQAADSEDDYLYARGLFGLLLIDNVRVLAEQLHKALPHIDLNVYAYGLAGSRDPQGRVLLETMKNHSNERVRTAITNALNSRWISAPRNASSIVAAQSQGLLATSQIHQIQSALNLMEASYIDEWKLCFLTSNQHLMLEDVLIKALSSGDQIAQHKAIKALCWLTGTTIQEWNSSSGLVVGKRSPLWLRRLSSEKIQEIEKFLQRQNLGSQTLAEACLLLTKEQGINPVCEQADWIYEIAVIADGEKPRRQLLALKPTGRSTSVDWMRKFLVNEFPQEWSCWIAQALGALGIFTPEMIRPLTFLFTNLKYTEADRDEALIYLAMIDIPQAAPVMVLAADLILKNNNPKDEYYSGRGLLGLLLLDDINVLAEQMLKNPPDTYMIPYAYGLAGSCNPQGRVLLEQMRNNSNERVRAAIANALSRPWISPSRTDASVKVGSSSQESTETFFGRFTDKAIKVIMLGQEEARRLRHNFVGTEQILLGLIGEGTDIAAATLNSNKVNLKNARVEVEKIIGRGSDHVATEIPFTPRAKRLLELSRKEADELGHRYVGTEHLLLGLIRGGDGVAVQVLKKLGVNLPRLKREVLQAIARQSK